VLIASNDLETLAAKKTVHDRSDISSNQQIFLVFPLLSYTNLVESIHLFHAWTFDAEEARHQIQKFVHIDYNKLVSW
jgi:hypothetical protein